MSGSRLRPYVGPLAALLVVLVIGAGTVYAAIPNARGTYYACLIKDTGAARLIDYPKVKRAPGASGSSTGVSRARQVRRVPRAQQVRTVRPRRASPRLR
jgi:hypothetical protein